MTTPRRFPYSALLLLVIPAFYLATMAQTVVWGDPTEYTFVAHVLGIAHPPGYAFYTLLAKLVQTVVPFGTVAWRTHLVSVATVTVAAFFIFGAVTAVGRHVLPVARSSSWPRWFDLPVAAGLFAGLAAGAAANIWQHGIHANPHIVTAAFLVANLFLLTRWGIAERTGDPHANRWLFAFSLSAGLGVTHHPLTVFGFPAYALFILVVRPSIWRDWRTVLAMVGFAALGLAVWLYFPLRSAMVPPFGPSTMNTLDGFLDHVLARGLSNSLPFYRLVDLPDRLLVFWTLLRLQYTLPVIALAALGLARLAGPPTAPSRLSPRHLLLLYALALLGVLAFVLNLRAQDIMAYLLGPFMVVALLSGIGLIAVVEFILARAPAAQVWAAVLVAALFLLGPVWQFVANAPRISLRSYDAASRYPQEVLDRFGSSGEAAVLLNDWEHMTPLWYGQFVDGRWPDAADVRPVLVSTAQPWLESVFAYLPGGPVYLSNYRREIVDAGFRLRPDGSLYAVVEPGETGVPSSLTPANAVGGALEVAGYDLPATAAPGEFVPLTLALRAPAGTADYYVPILRVGDITFSFTTDSHLITPLWEPGEVIVERFDFALPHDLPTGDYPITLGLKNLSMDSDTGLVLALGTLAVAGDSNGLSPAGLLGNFRQRVGLAGATARRGPQRAAAPWTEPLVARPGEVVNLTLDWAVLAPAEESYTVFVHLIDAANRPLVALDYTPLGGSAPTHLWIPKWLTGQWMLDPYRLTIPTDIAPGTYYIEVGLYEMVSGRRLHMADEAGNLIGDRLILGPVVVPNATQE
jgi:hypothetical protein